MPVIRALDVADHPALLRINAAQWPAVARLNAVELRRLAAIGDLHRVAVDDGNLLLGYLLAFAVSDAYGGEEFRHFRANLKQPFLYVDQIAVATSGRRQGIGRALYETLAAQARQRGLGLLCCEVNANPPNPHSMAFHLRLGFEQIGTLAVSDGRVVALLTRATPGFN